MALAFFQTVKSFAQFLNNWVVAGRPFVDQATADARAAICAICHANVATSEIKGGCSICRKGGSKVIDGIRSTIIGTKRTSSDSKLKVCGICGCDLKMSVWMPNAALLDKEIANAYPSFCWKKAILEDRDIL